MKLIDLYRVTLTGLLVCTLSAYGQQVSNNVEQRVNNILNQMTLEEKLSYIGGTYTSTTYGVFNIRGIPRLGLPEIDMCNGPLGIQSLIGQDSTRYPAGLALASSWNRDRALARGRQMGRDGRARAFYVDLGPGVDPYRTPLGGRNFEYNTGEDPFLGSQIVAPLIFAMQQQGVWTCVKHYACNEQEYRRESIDIELPERPLREIYLPPFEAAVKQGQAASVMGALNAVYGSFCCENYYLDTEILKKEWGFDGVLLSDYQGIHDGVKAAQAGCDLDMPFGDFMNPQTLLPAIQSGQLSVSQIDDKVRRILRKIVSFGFLDRPQLDSSIPLDDPASALEALNEAREGIVLLKNEPKILPLDRNSIHSIAVLGRLASGIPATGFGSSWLVPIRSVSELSGIQGQAGNVRVDFINAGSPDPATAPWEFLPTSGSVEVGLQGQYFNSNDLSGSPAVTQIDRELNFDWTQTGAIPAAISVENQASFSALWTGRMRPTLTGDHLFKVRADGGVRLYVNGQLLIDTFLSPMPPPVYGTTIPTFAKIYLQAGQAYDVKLEYRRTSGFTGNSGALEGVQFSWAPLVVPQVLSTYDAVVMCQGIDSEYDGEGMDLAFKFEDQGLAGLGKAIIMPEYQDELIQNARHANPRVIVVLHGTGNFDIQSWVYEVPCLLHAWYPGENGGQALGEILFGDVNPSGKLPVTMEKHLQDNPTTANYPLTSDALTIHYTEGIYVGYRGYEKNQIEPQFPFGYGLSYTNFAYSDLDIRPKDDNKHHDLVKVSFTVTNTGQRAGGEVAELYVGQQNPTIDRPIKELKGFQKVFLKPGESQLVTLELDQRSFAYFNTAKELWDAVPGIYNVLVGGSSQDTPLKGRVSLKSEFTSKP